MKLQRIRKILNILLVLFSSLALLFAVLQVSHIVFEDYMHDVLNVTKDLERQGLLENIPNTVPEPIRSEIEFIHSTKCIKGKLYGTRCIKKYMEEGIESAKNDQNFLIISVFLWFLCLGTRIYYKKKKDPVLL